MNFALDSASSSSGMESAMMPQPANNRTRVPPFSIWAERRPMPHSPSPDAPI